MNNEPYVNDDLGLAQLEDTLVTEPAKEKRHVQLDSVSQLYGVRFEGAGQVLFFPATDIAGAVRTKILVAFDHGQMLGEIVSIITPDELSSACELGEGSLVRLADAQDIATHTENRLLAAEAAAFCKSCIRQRNLDMKLVDVEVMHDKSKMIFFFTAPTRIDFRELVKDLVRTYRTRIELRQIGVRHEAQMIGGLGNCGMVCCCHQYLRKFAPVTIKMAKEQNLFLNPAKLSGMCGRLLCCLSFEQSNYEEFNRRAPKIGKRYTVDAKVIRVTRTNMFANMIYAIGEGNTEISLTLEEWEEKQPRRAEHSGDSRGNATGAKAHQEKKISTT